MLMLWADPGRGSVGIPMRRIYTQATASVEGGLVLSQISERVGNAMYANIALTGGHIVTARIVLTKSVGIVALLDRKGLGYKTVSLIRWLHLTISLLIYYPSNTTSLNRWMRDCWRASK